jgi:hypothetical protein
MQCMLEFEYRPEERAKRRKSAGHCLMIVRGVNIVDVYRKMHIALIGDLSATLHSKFIAVKRTRGQRWGTALQTV